MLAFLPVAPSAVPLRRALLCSLLAVLAAPARHLPAQQSAPKPPASASDAGMELMKPSDRIQHALDSMESTTSLQSPFAVELSPDGKQLAWLLGTGGRRGGSGELHLSSFDHPSATDPVVSAGKDCPAGSPRFSPDGSTLAFVATCADGQPQLYLRGSNGQVRQLTHIKGTLTEPAWAPDGKSIAFLYVENASRSAGALAAMKPPAGVIGREGVEVQWVAAADAQTGVLSILSPRSLHAFEFDWAPDGQHLAFVAVNPPGENNWWIAKLYTTAVGQPDAAKAILDPATVGGPLHGLQIAVPRYSTNGQNIAFIGGLMSDQGSTGGDIWLMGADGSGLQNLTPGRKSTPAYLAWADPDHLVFSEYVSGKSHIGLLGTNKHELTSGWTAEQSVGSGRAALSFAFSPAARAIAFTSGGPQHAAELYGGDFRGIRALTHLNDAVKSAGKTVSVEWDNDSFHVQGWLTYPASFDPAKKYPMIVSVHGGPSAEVGPSFNSGAGIYPALGYFFFQPNPRGSFGQGEAFTMANRKDFGYGDLRDVLKGVDAVEAKLPVDDNRLGLTGWSYGGFMTMFGITQTTRFHAAVAGAGISDWQSYYGENSIAEWMVPFFGATVYQDPAVYAKSSAITFIDRAKTPELILVGDRDGECPAPQSFEMWSALKAVHVPTELVVYPAEGHGFVNPAHIKDRTIRSAAWFDKYLQ